MEPRHRLEELRRRLAALVQSPDDAQNQRESDDEDDHPSTRPD
jgi:hypothetical protein